MKYRNLVLMSLILIFSAHPMTASIIRKPPVKTGEVTYKDLVCTEQDKAYIYEIISTVAETSKLSLAFKKGQIEEKGAQILHVHPLKFLSTIFTNPYLKSCMYYVWDDYFKKMKFMGGLVPNLTRESEKGRLEQYIKEFSVEVGVPAENLKPYFDAHDWENLVLHLIQS